MAMESGELELLRATASGCMSCQLSESRHSVVFGEGPDTARFMFIGEAPGRLEDESGRPFCGRSGLLLDQLLEAAGIDRSTVFVTSIVKCRPPQNRNPKSTEIAACAQWLDRQVAIIKPAIICTLGNFALRAVRADRTGITEVHGIAEKRNFNGREIVLFPLFHPAAALRSTGTRKLLAEDLLLLARLER